MRFQVGRVDHDDLLFAAFGGQPLHHPGEDAHVAPPLPAIVEGLGRAMLPRSVTPPQPIAIDEDYALGISCLRKFQFQPSRSFPRCLPRAHGGRRRPAPAQGIQPKTGRAPWPETSRHSSRSSPPPWSARPATRTAASPRFHPAPPAMHLAGGGHDEVFRYGPRRKTRIGHGPGPSWKTFTRACFTIGM